MRFLKPIMRSFGVSALALTALTLCALMLGVYVTWGHWHGLLQILQYPLILDGVAEVDGLSAWVAAQTGPVWPQRTLIGADLALHGFGSGQTPWYLGALVLALLQLLGALGLSPAHAVNVAYLLSFVGVAWAMYVLARALRQPRGLSVVLGLLFTSLHFHITTESNYFLQYYWAVPISIWIVMNLWARQSFSYHTDNNPDMALIRPSPLWLQGLLLLVLSLSHVQFVLIHAMWMVVMGVVGLLVFKSFKFLLSWLIYFVAGLILPFWLYLHQQASIWGAALNRSAGDVENMALKWVELLVPTSPHRVPVLDRFGDYYIGAFEPTTPLQSASVGLVAATGVLALIGLSLVLMVWRARLAAHLQSQNDHADVQPKDVGANQRAGDFNKEHRGKGHRGVSAVLARLKVVLATSWDAISPIVRRFSLIALLCWVLLITVMTGGVVSWLDMAWNQWRPDAYLGALWLAALGLLAWGLLLQAMNQVLVQVVLKVAKLRRTTNRWLPQAVLGLGGVGVLGLLGVGLFDQTLRGCTTCQSDKFAHFVMDQQFTSQIMANQTHLAPKVWLLPGFIHPVQSPLDGKLYHPYSLLWAHPQMAWNVGLAVRGDAQFFYQRMSLLPLAEQTTVARALGFTGLVVDTQARCDAGAQWMQSLGAPLAKHPDGGFAYYAMPTATSVADLTAVNAILARIGYQALPQAHPRADAPQQLIVQVTPRWDVPLDLRRDDLPPYVAQLAGLSTISIDSTQADGTDWAALPPLLPKADLPACELKNKPVVRPVSGQRVGRWSDAHLAKAIDIRLAANLPARFKLTLTLQGAGANVGQDLPIRVGDVVQHITPSEKMATYTVDFDLSDTALQDRRTIRITPPEPFTPAISWPGSNDRRRIAVQLQSLQITPL